MVKFSLKSGQELSIDGYLKNVLDSIVYNCNKDWDFVIIITGDGNVRTGKSVLAMNVCAYLADQLNTPFNLDNIHFDSKTMIAQAQHAPKNSVFQYDEAREGLATIKRFSKIQQDLVDFFNECGQLNHIFVLVLPDFFSLHWELATNRSECLLNVYRNEANTTRLINKEKTDVTIFQRGFFEFFNKKKKATLYYKGKRSGLREYGMVTPNFRGRYANHYPVDESEYRKKKLDALSRFAAKHNTKKEKLLIVEKAAIRLLERHKGKLRDMAREDGLNEKHYSNMLYELRKKAAELGEDGINPTIAPYDNSELKSFKQNPQE